jgi:hypothetical protein
MHLVVVPRISFADFELFTRVPQREMSEGLARGRWGPYLLYSSPCSVWATTFQGVRFIPLATSPLHHISATHSVHTRRPVHLRAQAFGSAGLSSQSVRTSPPSQCRKHQEENTGPKNSPKACFSPSCMPVVTLKVALESRRAETTK